MIAEEIATNADPGIMKGGLAVREGSQRRQSLPGVRYGHTPENYECIENDHLKSVRPFETGTVRHKLVPQRQMEEEK